MTGAESLALTIALLNICIALALSWQTRRFFDFAVFYASAAGWLAGASPYTVPNLNPPAFVVITSPLTWLPLPVAWLVWQLASVAAFAWTVRLVLRATKSRATGTVVAGLAIHASTAAQMQFGQVAWVLGVPLAYGWRAWRSGHTQTAGAWLGLVMAVKPFVLPALVVALVSRRWRSVSVVALGVATAVACASALVVGLEPFRAYLDLSHRAWGSTDQPTVASLTAWLYRASGSRGWSVGLASVVWVPVLMAWRRMDADHRWLAVLTSVLLVNPLGWLHYQAWLVAPVLALWAQGDRRLVLSIGIAAGCLPPVIAAAVPLLQPLYLGGLLAVWASALGDARLHREGHYRGAEPVSPSAAPAQ
jgi:hypothetical protein